VDADLGGGLVKQRVARRGERRSGGYRTLMAFRAGSRTVFVYGFAKSERDNIGPDELDFWRRVARRAGARTRANGRAAGAARLDRGDR